MSVRLEGKSRLTSKKNRKQLTKKHVEQNSHQQSDSCQMASTSPEPTSTQSKECLENASHIHIIHISDLKSILAEMITTFETQSLISGSPLLCLDMDSMPRLLRHIIGHRCHNIRSKREVHLANNVYSDEDVVIYKSDMELTEVYWSPRDGQSGQKEFTPRSKCKTKKRGPVSIRKDEVVGLVSRILQRSRNLSKKSFPILNPEDIPNLIMKEKITLRNKLSENSICVSDVPKLIMEVMDGEISVSVTDIFSDNQKYQDENHNGKDVQFSARENTSELLSQQQSILEDCLQIKQDVNKQNVEDSTMENREELGVKCSSLVASTIEERKDTIPPESESSSCNIPPHKAPKRMPRVSSICGDVCYRSSKRYMDPTIASTARATFDDPFYPPSNFTKKYPGSAANGISKVPAVSVSGNNDRCVPSEVSVKQEKHNMRGRRYKIKECGRPWESPLCNPNQLYCLEKVNKESSMKTKGEKRLLEELREQRPSPRPIAHLGKKAQMTKSESSLVDVPSLVEPREGRRPHSEERLLQTAERLKTTAVPKVKMPDWNPAPKSSPREAMISLQNEYGMKIIDKMIKPKKLSKALKTKN